MKFLLSEGRVVCLLEREDADTLPNRDFPTIDLLLVPLHYKDHIEKSHTWSELYPKVHNGMRNVVYF